MLRLAGPLAGAGLFVLIGGHAVAVLDAATFAVPVVTLIALRVAEPAPEPRRHRWRAEVTAGLRYVWQVAALRHIVIATACALTVFGFGETIIYAIVSAGLHEPAAFVGLLVAIQGGGAIVGGLTAAPLVRRIGEGRLVGVAMLIISLGAVLQMPPLLPSVIAGVALVGVAIPGLVVGFINLIQRRPPPELQGRAYSAADTLVTTPQTISIALGAALIGVAGYRPLLAAMAAVIGLAAAYLLTRPEQRRTGQARERQSRPSAIMS